MSSDDRDPYSFSQMTEDDLRDMLLDDYDPATDICGLLMPIMRGVMAVELAGLALAEKEEHSI
jgi:hypothetical protein